jgi:hypothetical protein
MLSILTDSNNDIYIDSSGNIAMDIDIVALGNVAKNKVLTTLGEPQYNQLAGIPYFETVFCDNPQIALFQTAVIQSIKTVDNVLNVTDFNYKQNNNILSYSLTINSIFGDIQLNG